MDKYTIINNNLMSLPISIPKKKLFMKTIIIIHTQYLNMVLLKVTPKIRLIQFQKNVPNHQIFLIYLLANNHYTIK